MIDFFQKIEGQKRVKNILSKFNSNHKIPHALLFSGNDGVGKEKIAVEFAKLVNSDITDVQESDRVINLISNLTEPYIKFIIPLPRGKYETESDSPTDKLSKEDIELIQEELKNKSENLYYKIRLPKANTIKINSIREIKKFASLNYSDIKYRFIIISDAHLMNEASQNALLKNLEEPPQGVVFILVTPYPGKLRETIRSRCWNINFDPLSQRELFNVLVNEFGIDEKTAESAGPFANGSSTVALKLIEMNINSLSEKTISILRYSFGKKYHSAFDEFSEMLRDRGSENIQLIVKMLITWLNDLQKYKLNIDHYFFKEYSETLEKFNNRFPDVELNVVVSTLDRLASYTKNNVNINLLMANIIFELSTLTQQGVE